VGWCCGSWPPSTTTKAVVSRYVPATQFGKRVARPRYALSGLRPRVCPRRMACSQGRLAAPV
jgi:hypothetical protein